MVEERSFLKQHGFLVAGVALPVLVVVGFVLARTLPRLWVNDPLYDVVYLVRSGYDSLPSKMDRTVSVVDGRLRVRWTKLENQLYGQPLHVYRLHPATGAAEEVRIPSPLNPDSLQEPTDLPVGGLESFRIDTSPRASDGYEFEGPSGGSSGVMGEIFIHRSREARCVISKGGRVIVLPSPGGEPYGYSPIQFLGWLVPLETRR